MPQSFRRIRLLPVLLVLALIQGCGWHLRGDSELPAAISPVYIQGIAEFDRFRMDLAKILRSNNVEISTDRKQAATLLRIRDRDFNKRVLSVIGETGKVAEYELHDEVAFDMLDASGNVLVPEQRIGITRSYLNQEDEVLGKRREEEISIKEMRQDLASRLVRRLQAHLK